MSRNIRICRALSILSLLFVFTFTSLPAQAQPVRHSTSKVSVLGEGMFAWFRNLLASLGFAGMAKEGVMIDPDGVESPEGTSIDPNGLFGDEGVMIDPNG